MKVEEISTDKIKENPWNPNEMGERLYKALVRDVKENGFVQPILVRKQGKAYEVVDGALRTFPDPCARVRCMRIVGCFQLPQFQLHFLDLEGEHTRPHADNFMSGDLSRSYLRNCSEGVDT